MTNGVTMKATLLALSIIGLIFPLYQFLPWFAENGFDIELFISLALSNPISRFAWADILVSAITVLLFAWLSRDCIGLGWVTAVFLGTLLAGVSMGLPLLLYALVNGGHVSLIKKR